MSRRPPTTTEDWQRPVDALAYVLVIAGSVSLYWRRRAPIVVLAFVTAVLVAMYLREYGAFLSVLGLPALYAVAAHEEHRRRGMVGGRDLVHRCSSVAASVSVLDRPDGLRLPQRWSAWSASSPLPWRRA